MIYWVSLVKWEFQSNSEMNATVEGQLTPISLGSLRMRAATEALASVPPKEERVLVATGRYLGEGFDDARLDTLFLTMPISWRGTLAVICRTTSSPARAKARRDYLRLCR